MAKLSIALAVFNEETNLDRCLNAVDKWADEIVIVDGGSTDHTVDIAKKFHAKIIETNNPPIFHINKQKALNACTGDWILQLDADEVVTIALINEINNKIREKSDFSAYYIPRKNYFLGKWLKKGGLYPDYVIRLFVRGKGSFPQKNVHEQIEIKGKIGFLKNPLDHYTYRSIDEYWRKANTYINLTADEYKVLKLKKSLFNYLKYNLFLPLKRFLQLYFRHKGFLDGKYGFLFALYSSMHFPIAYNRYLNSSK